MLTPHKRRHRRPPRRPIIWRVLRALFKEPRTDASGAGLATEKLQARAARRVVRRGRYGRSRVEKATASAARSILRGAGPAGGETPDPRCAARFAPRTMRKKPRGEASAARSYSCGRGPGGGTAPDPRLRRSGRSRVGRPRLRPLVRIRLYSGRRPGGEERQTRGCLGANRAERKCLATRRGRRRPGGGIASARSRNSLARAAGCADRPRFGTDCSRR
jgi:hypothetical protein